MILCDSSQNIVSAPPFPTFPQSDRQKWQHSGNTAVPPRWSAWPFCTNGYFSHSFAQLKDNWRLREAGDIIPESAYVIYSISKWLRSNSPNKWNPREKSVLTKFRIFFFSFCRDLTVESEFFTAQNFSILKKISMSIKRAVSNMLSLLCPFPDSQHDF